MKIIGYDACILDVHGIVEEQGAVIFGTLEEAAQDALKLAKECGLHPADAMTRTVYDDGVRSINY